MIRGLPASIMVPACAFDAAALAYPRYNWCSVTLRQSSSASFFDTTVSGKGLVRDAGTAHFALPAYDLPFFAAIYAATVKRPTFRVG